jgi:hypothetical protein
MTQERIFTEEHQNIFVSDAQGIRIRMSLQNEFGIERHGTVNPDAFLS